MKNITICGVGALGSNAVMMCRNLEAKLTLIDFDRVESKNLLIQAFVKQSLNKNKAMALKMQLQNFYGVKVEAKSVRLTKLNIDELLNSADLIVDCFDNAASRRLLSEFASENSVPLVHGAVDAEGTFGLVRWDENFEADEEDVKGQATCEGGENLSLVSLVSATLARAIQDFISKQIKSDYMVNLQQVVKTC